jgi:hypothetical protein
MKLIISFIIFAALACGQGINTSVAGGTAFSQVGVSSGTNALDGAGDTVVFRWQQPAAKTLSKVLFRVTAITGTVGANDLVTELLYTIDGSAIATVTYTDASDIVNLTGHPFANGDAVRFGAATTLPAGLTANTTYYVCSAATNSFQVDDSAGCGSVVTDFSGSSGAQTVRHLLQETNTVTAAPTGAQNVEITGFSTALTAGESYAVSIRHVNTGSSTVTVGAVSVASGSLPWVSFPAQYSATSMGSVLALTTATTLRSFRLEFSDGSFLGSITNGANTSENVYGTAVAGARITAPPSKMSVIGICAALQIVGVPASAYEFKLYTGANASESLVASTASFTRRAIPTASATTGPTCALFSSAVDLTASTVYRAVVAPVSSGDSSSNRVSLFYSVIPDSSADKLLWGSRQKATCTVPCSAGGWTYEDKHIPYISLLLSDGSEYTDPAAAASGGSYVFVQ